jgi:hypothetical protein
LERLNILAYGISITTLEDVFMKVGHMEEPLEVLDGSKNPESKQEVFGSQLSRQYSIFNLMSIRDLSEKVKVQHTNS